MPISAEAIQTHIPFYLTQDQKDGLIKTLGAFRGRFNITSPNYLQMGRRQEFPEWHLDLLLTELGN